MTARRFDTSVSVLLRFEIFLLVPVFRVSSRSRWFVVLVSVQSYYKNELNWGLLSFQISRNFPILPKIEQSVTVSLVRVKAFWVLVVMSSWPFWLPTFLPSPRLPTYYVWLVTFSHFDFSTSLRLTEPVCPSFFEIQPWSVWHLLWRYPRCRRESVLEGVRSVGWAARCWSHLLFSGFHLKTIKCTYKIHKNYAKNLKPSLQGGPKDTANGSRGACSNRIN